MIPLRVFCIVIILTVILKKKPAIHHFLILKRRMNAMNMAALIVGIAAAVTLGYYLIPVFSPTLAERLKIAEAEKAPSDSETER
jgi:ethanolamine transporter EutH